MLILKCRIPLKVDLVFAHCSYFIHSFVAYFFLLLILVQLTFILGKSVVFCLSFVVFNFLLFLFLADGQVAPLLFHVIICELCYCCGSRLLLELKSKMLI